MSNNGGLSKMWNEEGVKKRWIKKYSFGWTVKMSEMSKSRSEERRQESWNENFLELIVSKKQQTPISTCSEKSNPGPNEPGRAIACVLALGGAFCFT